MTKFTNFFTRKKKSPFTYSNNTKLNANNNIKAFENPRFLNSSSLNLGYKELWNTSRSFNSEGHLHTYVVGEKVLVRLPQGEFHKDFHYDWFKAIVKLVHISDTNIDKQYPLYFVDVDDDKYKPRYPGDDIDIGVVPGDMRKINQTGGKKNRRRTHRRRH